MNDWQVGHSCVGLFICQVIAMEWPRKWLSVSADQSTSNKYVYGTNLLHAKKWENNVDLAKYVLGRPFIIMSRRFMIK